MEEQLAKTRGLLYFSPLLTAAGASEFLSGFPAVLQQSPMTIPVDVKQDQQNGTQPAVSVGRLC